MSEKNKEKKETNNENVSIKNVFNTKDPKFLELFAKKLMQQLIYNPNKSTTRSSTRFTNYTRENVIEWIQNPAQNEKNLRGASNYLYAYSMPYQRLINYYANLPLWMYVITPLNFDKSKVKEDAFRKQYYKVANTLELMNIQDEMKNMVITAIREGVFYGVRWLDSSSSFVQKLNPDYCKITHLSDGVFLFTFDMSQIKKEEELESYPQEFKKMYSEYKKTGEKYQLVPDEISFCLKADPTTIDYSLPLFSSVLPQIFKIMTTEDLQEVSDEIKNYKMISGKIPLDSDGIPKMDFDEVMRYYNILTEATGSSGIGVAVTPFDLNSFDFDKSGSVAELDNVARTIKNYWATVGSSALLHGLSDGTAGVTKLGIKSDEGISFKLMEQCQRLINRYLKIKFKSNQLFKIIFLPITIYNQDEMIQRYKEAISYGLGKSHYMASIGIHQFDFNGLTYIENEILDIDNTVTPLLSGNVMSGSGEAGRKAEKEEDLDASGEATRGNDANANR